MMTVPYKDASPASTFNTYGLFGSDYMPAWMQPTTINYQAPGLAKDLMSYGTHTTGTSATPRYLYQQQYGGMAMNAPSNNQGMSALDKMSAIGQGVQAFATLAGLYTGYKGLQYQKKQFNFTKSAWNKNFAAQLGAYDNALRDNYEKYRAGNSYFGNPVQSEQDWMSQRSLSHLVG